MMARSTCSNQRPDTLLQDRICQVDETSCNARPDHTFGSHSEELAQSITGPLYPRTADVISIFQEVRVGPNSGCEPWRVLRRWDTSLRSEGKVEALLALIIWNRSPRDCAALIQLFRSHTHNQI